jgi:hypothetical protein
MRAVAAALCISMRDGHTLMSASSSDDIPCACPVYWQEMEMVTEVLCFCPRQLLDPPTPLFSPHSATKELVSFEMWGLCVIW